MTLAAAEAVRSAARGTWHVFGDFSFADPLFLVLVPAVLAVLAWGRRAAARPRGRVPLAPAGLPRTLRQRLLWLPPLLHGAALVLVVVALARPLRGNVLRDVVSEGVDIVVAIDRSGSMEAPDLEEGRTRLEVVKDVAGDFAERRMSGREGAADNVALVAFARYPRLVCPFTLDADAFLGLLDAVELARSRAEDGTAIGVALAKAVALLRDGEAESRVVVLLTDGQNNVDAIAPLEAAELAAEEGIRVHTIYSARYVFETHPFLGRRVATDVEPDTRELEAIAAMTGGRFFRALDREGLEEIYAEIERLERTERSEERHEETFDLYPWLLLPALAVYALAWLSRSTWARRIP